MRQVQMSTKRILSDEHVYLDKVHSPVKICKSCEQINVFREPLEWSLNTSEKNYYKATFFFRKTMVGNKNETS